MDAVSPLPTRTAAALQAVLDLVDSAGTGTLDVAAIRELAASASAFDPDRMRLRIDDLHGNRCLVQRVGGVWQALSVDGRQLSLAYPFGALVDVAALVRDLDCATTIHGVTQAAIAHLTRVADVQVEAIWERHLFRDGQFRHVPIAVLRAA